MESSGFVLETKREDRAGLTRKGFVEISLSQIFRGNKN